MDPFPDPRRYASPGVAGAAASELHVLAAQSLAGETAQASDGFDATIASRLAAILERADGAALAATLNAAPTLAVYRHLWRAVARLAGTAAGGAEGGLAVTLFAIPVVIVAAGAGSGPYPGALSGVLPDSDVLADVLREHGALAGNGTFALANALVRAETIDIANLPALLAARKLPEGQGFVPLALPPAPIEITAGERAHLRFLVGSALSAPGAKLLSDAGTGRWGMPLAKALIAQLSVPGATVIALPRAATGLPAAVAQGHAAQREVSAQLFASHALRELRASVGEPVAIISAHAADTAPRGGELRLSLSSPFAPRDAHGFVCPLYAGDAAPEVARMLVDLLRDCRVADVRILDGVHADRDALTGGPLLFKPATIPDGARVLIH